MIANFDSTYDFALISPNFVCWGCNFTWIITINKPFYRILLTDLQKQNNKIYFGPRSETLQKFDKILIKVKLSL